MKNNKGFTLVELAIVLVIIGLLVGGVLQGQELIKQAQIRSTLSKISAFDAAVNTFRAKYRGLPGDITRASTYGFISTATPAVYVSTTDGSTTAANVNGNGDGRLQYVITAGSLSYAAYGGEISNFWVHLSASNMIAGTIACNSTADDVCVTNAAADTNFPGSPIGVGFIAVTQGSSIYYLNGLYGGFTSAAAITTAANATSGASALGLTLTTEEAFGIDSKYDDGLPNTGNVRAVGGYTSPAVAFTAAANGATECASATGAAGEYSLTLTTNAVCSLAIKASM